MARGRPPKPTVIKLLTGNPGNRPLNTSEPQPAPTPPPCPEWLSEDAKAKWAELVPELSRLGLLTIVDGAVLAGFCQSYAEAKQATERLEAEGRYLMVGGWPVDEVDPKNGETRTRVVGGQLQPHPAVSQQRSALKAMKEFAALFGLEPSSRSRLHVQPQEAAKKPGVGARKRG